MKPFVLPIILCALTAAACGSAAAPQILQPGAPGEATRVIDAARASDLSGVQHTAADVQFMHRMIAHHAQALEMTALVPDRTTREAMHLLAERIEVAQADEMEMMRDWLEARGQTVTGPHAHHAHGAAPMPGMAGPEEMARLAGARGDAFDRLFLELMIRHHEGALVMVKELFSTPGAGQEPEIFAFTSDAVADQGMEIARMARMLKELQR